MSDTKRQDGSLTPEQRYQALLAQANFVSAPVAAAPEQASAARIGQARGASETTGTAQEAARDAMGGGVTSTATIDRPHPEMVEVDALSIFSPVTQQADPEVIPAAGGQAPPPPPPSGSVPLATGPSDRMFTYAKWGIGAVTVMAVLGVVMFMFSSGSSTETEASMPVRSTEFQGVQMPVSEEAGPATFDATTASGYAHSKEGAALAALHLSVRSDARVGPLVFEPLIGQQVTGDQATIASMLEDRRAEYTKWAEFKGVTGGAPVIFPGGYTQVGWKVPSWSETGPITVHLLMEDPKTKTLQDLAPVVEWDATANDYKLVVTSNRGYAPATQVQPTDRSSYTLFANE